MANDIYLQIDGIKGESTDADHKDWIEIHSFSHAISHAATAGGGTTGRAKHDDFVISKSVDLASPKIYEACSSGKHIKKVVIEMMRASGGSRVKYLTIEMDQAIVSKVQLNAGEGEGSPRESVTFDYGVIKWTYTQQKRADGSKGGNTTGGWDLAGDKAIS